MAKSKKNNKPHLKLLETYKAALMAWDNDQETLKNDTAVRTLIERDTPAIHKIVWQAGCGRIVPVTPPAMVGNMMTQHQDPFLFVLEGPYGVSMASTIIEMIDETIELIKAEKLPQE